jgi:hypothetical protein
VTDKPKSRHGNLKIDAPLEDVLRAALEVKPPEKPAPSKKKTPKKS